MPKGFIPKHGGYQDLLSYQRSVVVYDLTVAFCHDVFHRFDRTIDQMVQAARSGKQNIIEGSMASGTSKETEIKLTNVARASLEELLEEKRVAIPENYYHLLETNKQRFEKDTMQSEAPMQQVQGGRSNMKYVETRLKDPVFKRCKKFTDLDEEFLTGVRHMVKQGTIAKKVAQTLKKEFEKTVDPLEMLAILRKQIRVIEEQNPSKNKRMNKREIILSIYQKRNR